MKLRDSAARFALLAWLLGCCAFAGVRQPALLMLGIVAVVLVFRAQAKAAARKTLSSAAPVTVVVLGATWAHAFWVLHLEPDLGTYAALALRAGLLTFATLAVLEAVDLYSAVAPWPVLGHLLVGTLARVHALRLLADESWPGLRSRFPRKPSLREGMAGAVRGAATLRRLSRRNMGEISEALRARGF